MNNKNKHMEAKLHSASLYGKTVLDLAKQTYANEYCDVENCRHFDAETFNCTKKHHCDCDCPECSSESYI